MRWVEVVEEAAVAAPAVAAGVGQAVVVARQQQGQAAPVSARAADTNRNIPWAFPVTR
jgi:hypothetical protein